MVYKVYSGRVGGVFGDLITVEVDSSTGLPAFDMIGLLGSEVKEAKERVRVALKNNGINLPAMRITVNLSPADEHKSGAAFDLPIAVAILGVFNYIPLFEPKETLVIGELALDGQIKSVKGIIPIVKMAKERGFERVLLPADNAREGCVIKGIDIVAVSNLSEVFASLAGGSFNTFKASFDEPVKESYEDVPDFDDIYGQEGAKRAAALAAAGFHHLLMTGPPGSGKSLIAKSLPSIMPDLTYEESLEISSIYSVMGLLNSDKPFISRRPFYSPHHSASLQSLAGGGPNATPGLVSLSHRGILFLDEMPEFKREAIDMLRQPMEDGKIMVSRARNSYTYPAKFMLVGAMNPCPCGYFPDRNRCTCTQSQIVKYLSKISGPVADRIDICVEVPRMDPLDMNKTRGNVTKDEYKGRINDAIERQRARYRDENFKFNSFLPSSKTDKYIPLEKEAKEFVFSLYEKLKLSTRSFYKILKVARTIADFEGSDDVSKNHLMEASLYRFPDYVGGGGLNV